MYDAAERQVLCIGETITVEKDPDEKYREEMMNLVPYYVHGSIDGMSIKLPVVQKILRKLDPTLRD